MKVRVSRNNDLNKALDRTNLVLVDVMVNGRTGAYKSKRWKNPSTALNIAKNDIKRQAKNADEKADIKFKDKNTGKTVSDQEVTKKYLSSDNNKNLTLQAYIAENYKAIVGKEKAKNNSKNSTQIDNSEVSKIKNAKNTETMMRTEEYQHEKFSGVFSCGHEATYDAGGYTPEERQAKADDMLEEDCPRCKENKEKQRQIDIVIRDEIYRDKYRLPELEETEFGNPSPTLMCAAMEARNNCIKQIEPVIDRMKEKTFKKDGISDITTYALDAFMKQKDARYWLNMENKDIFEEATAFISGVSDIGNYDSYRFLIDRDEYIKPFEDAAAEKNRNTFIRVFNNTVMEYKNTLLESIRNNEEMAETGREKYVIQICRFKDILKWNQDPSFWKALNPSNTSLEKVIRYNQYKQLRVDEENLTPEQIIRKRTKANKLRNKIYDIAYEKLGKKTITESESRLFDNVLNGIKNADFYLKIDKMNFNSDDELMRILSDEVDKILHGAEEVIKEPKKTNWYAQLRFGTKKIEAEKSYPTSKDFKEYKNDLYNLQGMHTDVVAKAAMDMAGVNIPLYVKRNGNSFKIGNSVMSGFCRRTLDKKPTEIDVVDYPENRALSYSTAVHETMHALLGMTTSPKTARSVVDKMPIRFEEAIVETIGHTATKHAYKEEYRKKDNRSYKFYVVDTIMRLKQTRRFKEKTLSQIGDILGQAAFKKDGKFFDNINNELNKSVKSGKALSELVKDYDNAKNIERVAKKTYSEKNNGDMTHFEETELAKLVDRIKNTNFTLADALNNSATSGLAIVLLFDILDDEDDAVLGIL